MKGMGWDNIRNYTGSWDDWRINESQRGSDDD